ncbi:MAG: site-2 protease family protein [Oscillospiraceae bacterium]|nr:site-2 protease family protein [Oscillospiraceae bacterium]
MVITMLQDFFTMDLLFDIVIIAIPALICITVHELAHGFVAYRLGDDTAKNMGRLTLNPIKHIDPIGLAMILVIGFGWAKPVPVNMANFKNPKAGMALTALAGPLSNITLAFIVILIFILLPSPHGGLGVLYRFTEASILSQIIIRMAILNVALAIFNMLPMPPLDGSKILFSVLPENLYYKLMRYERYGMIVLLAIMLLGTFTGINIIGNIVSAPANSFFIHVSLFFDSLFF